MLIATTIEQKLRDALKPLALQVKDESALHAGHAGARPEGETHFRLFIVSERFAGLSSVARHRMVNETLREELRSRVHALAMQTLAPEEWEAENES